MGYPYGPQQGYDPYAGQGYAQPGYGADPYSGQPGYGAPPYGAPIQYGYGAPGYGFPPPGYGQPRPSGGTAITAAVISLLLALLTLTGIGIAAAVVFGTEPTSVTDERGREELTAGLAIGAVPALLWLLGSILLFRRKTAGRVLLILLSSLVVLGISVSVVAELMGADAGDGPATVFGAAIVAAIPLLILFLTAAPATGRWIRAGKQPQPYPYY
ncbi:hypothetical protein ACFO5K_21310 [Nocardia halotolerans]|uniref:Uncharacterized protein n=1 Tax=Nocardia halotolerans TaxID=1755878 RepID=A0ABV8VPS3_9NOCA